MKRKLVCIVTLAALYLPTAASAQAVAYTAAIQVHGSNGISLGYVATDPNYWTPLLSGDINNALTVSFVINGPTGTGINLATSPRNGFGYFGPIVGRDSTSSDIAAGSYNYFYLGHTNPTPPSSPPLSAGNYFAANTGLDKQSESAIWTVNIPAGTLVPEWVNTDGAKPATEVFVQSNHVYAGGDANAFHSRFPSPVAVVTLHLEILSAVPLLSITSLTANPNELWPPNHKMRPVTLTPTLSGGSSAVSCRITSVSSSEPVDPDGDWQIVGSLSLTLRAERLTGPGVRGNVNGRLYSITVECTDGVNSAEKIATVLVPLNQGK